jgi:hypothetical protein
MERPVTGTHSDPAAALERRTSAIAAGSVLSIGGLPIEVRASDEGRARAMAQLLIECPEADGDPVGRLHWDESTPPLPAREPDVDWWDLVLWREPDHVVFQRDPLVATASASELCVGGPADSLAFRRLFLAMSSHLLAHHGRFVVHAAAVVRDAGAVVFFGGSGQGKSTSVAAAMADGWRVLGDELIVLRMDGTGIEAQGIPRPLAIPGEVADGLIGTPIDADERSRIEIGVGAHDLGCWPVAATIGVGHGTGEGGLTDATPDDRLHSILASFTSSHERDLVFKFWPVASALSQLPAWHYATAADASRRVALAQRALAHVESSVSR